MQVSAIASEVSYYPDEASFTDNPITKIMGKPVLFPMNRAVNFLGSSIVTGEILSVRHYTFINRAKEEVPIYFVEVETQYGTLSGIAGEGRPARACASRRYHQCSLRYSG